MVEGVHFRLGGGWATPAEVGHRALAGALSDLAAMGAGTGEAYVSLGLPPGFDERDALELSAAADELAVQTGTAIAGGDVVAAPVLIVTVAVTGWFAGDARPVGRDGARAGQLVGVSGALGAGRAALEVLEGRASPSEETEPALARSRRPLPRLLEGSAIAAEGASAMIDVSDGLAADAGQLGRASGLELRLLLEELPVAPGVEAVADELGVPAAELAAAGGEDYELCFCIDPAGREGVERRLARDGGVGVSWIGEVAAGGPPGAVLLGGGGGVVRAEGFEHRW
jgi:thiamine-monophosphate kinase